MMRLHDCPDLDALFGRYLMDWMEAHADDFGTDLERAEEAVPEVYEAFLDTPCEALAFERPRAYFGKETDAAALVDWMCEYQALGIPIPDLLTERIVDQGKEAESALLSLLWQKDTDPELRLMCVSMLRELESTRPAEGYVDWIARSASGDELAAAAAESLAYMGSAAAERILQKFPEATEAGKDLFCDVLAGAPFNERIAAFLRERFLAHPENRALFASYLAKHGDEGALPLLEGAAGDPDIRYLDFIEVCGAIERLGGERPADREFSGDPDYEALKNL